jgi:hypothetical protein
MINFGFILVIFWVKHLPILPAERHDFSASKITAKLQQKVYYMQIFRFIFACYNKLKNSNLPKNNFILDNFGFI